jgi:hypothetical protein
MRNFARLCLAGVAVASSALLLSGCVQPAPVVTPAATSNSKPLFTSDEDALAAATKAYAAYVSMADRVFMEGGADAERMSSVASGQQLKADLEDFRQVSLKGEHSTGGTTFDQVKLQQRDGRKSDVVTVYLCEDISVVDVLDNQGKSLVSSDRPNRVVYEVAFSSAGSESTSLLVSLKEPWGRTRC